MSDTANRNFLLGSIGLALVIGALLTVLSTFHSRTTVGRYCNPDPEINAVIDCTLKVNNKGLPLAYEINPNFQPKHGVQSVELMFDVLTWSAVSYVAIFAIRRVKT